MLWLNNGLSLGLNSGGLNLLEEEEMAIKLLNIDGQFNFWDDGTSFTADGYGPTMWRLSEGGGAATITKVAFTFGQTDVAGNPTNHLNFDQSTGGTDVELSHRIENAGTCAGSSLSVSFYAKVASGTLSVTPEFRQNFGTGGSPSTEVATAGSAVTVTTSFTKFTQSIVLPSVSGKTLGTGGDDYLELVLKFPDSTVFDCDVANVATKEGAAFTGKWPTVNDERLLVHRYWQVIGDYVEGVPGGQVIPTFPTEADTPDTTRKTLIVLHTCMRAAPSATLGTAGAGTLDSATTRNNFLRVNATAATAASSQVFDYVLLDARL